MSLFSTGSLYSVHQSGRSSPSDGLASTNGLAPCHEAGTTYWGGSYVGARSTCGNQSLQADTLSTTSTMPKSLAPVRKIRGTCSSVRLRRQIISMRQSLWRFLGPRRFCSDEVIPRRRRDNAHLVAFQ